MAKKQSEFTQWMGPLLDALRLLGGSGSPSDVSNQIAETLKLPESKLSETIKSGTSKFHNQVCWARQYLVWEGYLDASIRGIWKLTKLGEHRHISNDEARTIFLKWVEINALKRKKKAEAEAEEEIENEEIDDNSSITVDYKQQVIEYLRTMSPKNFERFCLLMLRINNFENLKLTGGSHDDGIDGMAILRVNPFVSFRVIFQAKRYKAGNNISRAQIGDFRNAMIGRADKGIFITTSKFTQEAEKEANREGAPPIELVDSDQLIKMIELSSLGLKPISTFEIDHEFFKQYLDV
jgi:restriction system protein